MVGQREDSRNKTEGLVWPDFMGNYGNIFWKFWRGKHHTAEAAYEPTTFEPPGRTLVTIGKQALGSPGHIAILCVEAFKPQRHFSVCLPDSTSCQHAYACVWLKRQTGERVKRKTYLLCVLKAWYITDKFINKPWLSAQPQFRKVEEISTLPLKNQTYFVNASWRFVHEGASWNSSLTQLYPQVHPIQVG